MVSVDVGAASLRSVDDSCPEQLLLDARQVHQHRVHRQDDRRTDQRPGEQEDARAAPDQHESQEEAARIGKGLQQGNLGCVRVHGQRHPPWRNAQFNRQRVNPGGLGGQYRDEGSRQGNDVQHLHRRPQRQEKKRRPGEIPRS